MQQQADEILKENKTKTAEMDNLKKKLTDLETILTKAKINNPDQDQRIKVLEDQLKNHRSEKE